MHPPFNVNDQITFKLMKRARGSLFAYPADHNIRDQDTLFSVSEIGASDVQSKLLVANAQEVSAIIAREHRELAAALKEDENCPEKCFIEQAITLLKEREHFVVGETGKTGEKVEVCSSEGSLSLGKWFDEDPGLEKLEIRDEISANTCDDQVQGAFAMVRDLDMYQTKIPAKYFYFYQGQYCFHIVRCF